MATNRVTNSLVVATAEDDRFHPVTASEESWIETLWFPFWLPEEKMSCYVHVHFCPNKSIYRGSIFGWQADNELVFLERFEEPLPSLTEYGNLTNLSLPIGLRVASLKPQQTFEVSYRHATGGFHFIFDAIMLPIMMTPDASPGMFQGHMNQSGQARGKFELNGRQSSINCYTVRDRSWGPRKVSSGHRAGNCHGTGKGASFYIYVQPDEKGIEQITNGHFLMGDRLARVVAGERRIEWDDSRPVTIDIDAEDESGRRLRAHGECLNRRITLSPPNLCVVLNLVRWNVSGETLWGESHDVWSEDAWIASGKSPVSE